MKTTKYTDEDTQMLRDLFAKNEPLDMIAAVLDRTEASIRSKLTSLGLYKKAPYTAKDGTVPKKKEEYVKEIAEIIDVSEELADSLEKCTKFVLKKLLDKLKNP